MSLVSPRSAQNDADRTGVEADRIERQSARWRGDDKPHSCGIVNGREQAFGRIPARVQA
ncbi:hypothetical protein ACIBLA_14555 [Streptomyces sp. NPDC050433]|uniref:hypothetical protein n=1 Tax=Streptomyces sp. NPDC050433 TaxID=3365615 RepID=UPI0037A6F478